MSSQVATMPQQQPSLLAKIASKYSVDPGKMLTTLKATAFKGDVSNEQMMALLIVADQYGLNPWTKEIYAFPDRQNGIVPVIGVDGWARIINSHEQFDGMNFKQDAESCTCTIYRKDRAHPIEVTEYMAECKRNVGPWQSHPRRMLRHKAMIQCARLAFGFVGVYDQDEAERIVERDVTPQADDDHLPMTSRTESVKAKLKKVKAEEAPPESSDPDDEALAHVEQQPAAAPSTPVAVTFEAVAKAIAGATDVDTLDAHADLIGEVANESERMQLGARYKSKRAELTGKQ